MLPDYQMRKHSILKMLMSSKSNLSNRFNFAQEVGRNRESTESVAKFMTSEESDSAQMRTDPVKMPASKYRSARGIVER